MPELFATCIDCGETKSVEEFYRVRRGSEERQSRCKRCDNRKRTSADRREARAERRRGDKGKFCRLCAGLAHRVEGARCRACGLAYQEESDGS